MKIENLSQLTLSKEEIELIRRALHLEEVSICENYNDDIMKNKKQLAVIKKIYQNYLQMNKKGA